MNLCIGFLSQTVVTMTLNDELYASLGSALVPACFLFLKALQSEAMPVV